MTDNEQLRELQALNDVDKTDGLLPNQPLVPATTVACPNPYPFPVWVRILAGTVTVVSVDGVTIGGMVTAGLANGDWIRLRAGSSVTLTYSVAPTWQWFQE